MIKIEKLKVKKHDIFPKDVTEHKKELHVYLFKTFLGEYTIAHYFDEETVRASFNCAHFSCDPHSRVDESVLGIPERFGTFKNFKEAYDMINDHNETRLTNIIKEIPFVC